ncbi:MAG: putative DNA-binding transcriptional regulator YafY [Saprospiraceae bacterium]|jgi:predicted DNA-binding transcriptional regulator YafY
MNKFDRVISTLVLLQTKKVVKAAAIFERFGISLRTVYRDINTLRTAGIPIVGDTGIGYSIMEGYRLSPIMFNEGEAASLLTAEKFIGKMTDQDTQAYYSSALMKIKAILRSSEKQPLAVLDNSIAISDYNNKENKTYLQDLFKSIATKNVLYIHYQKEDGSTSNRKLEPIGCYYQFNNWYLVAFCQLQNDYRIFMINRIVTLQRLDQHFDTEHISLQNYIESQNEDWKAQHQFQTIEIAFKHDFVKFAESRKFYFGFVEQTIVKDAVHMKFQNSSLEIIARWLLQFGDQATVLAPAELKDRVKILATQLFRHYT